MYFFYPLNAPKAGPRRGQNDPDATLYWARHTQIALRLKSMLKGKMTFQAKARVLEELTIAEGKIKFWESRPNFDLQLAINASFTMKQYENSRLAAEV